MGKKTKKGSCIFCGQSGLTKQHVLPKWLKQLIPDETNEHGQLKVKIRRNAAGVLLFPEDDTRQGHMLSRKIRNVCAKCNNEWMSKLESDVKPILVSLIEGNNVLLTQEEQTQLSAWIALISIMSEYTDVSTLSISEKHRGYLREELQPPDQWKIWIGHYDGDERLSYLHHASALFNKNETIPKRVKGNTQFSTFKIGKLIVHAISSTFEGFDFNIRFKDDIDSKMVQIWPRVTNEAYISSEKSLSKVESEDIGNAYYKKSYIV